jgi:RNA polymerase sigma-70 factor (ECF subfamily)
VRCHLHFDHNSLKGKDMRQAAIRVATDNTYHARPPSTPQAQPRKRGGLGPGGTCARNTSTIVATPARSIPPAILDAARKLATRKARKLVGHYGWTRSDVEDIAQELLLDLIHRWPKYDPTRSEPEAFVAGIFNHHVETMIAARLAAKRDYRRARTSLNAEVGRKKGGRLVERGDLLADPADEPGEREAATDVASIVAELPDDLRAVCRLLMEGRTVAEVARETGVPLSTLRGRLAVVRTTLARAGLGPAS